MPTDFKTFPIQLPRNIRDIKRECDAVFLVVDGEDAHVFYNAIVDAQNRELVEVVTHDGDVLAVINHKHVKAFVCDDEDDNHFYIYV